LVAGREKRRPAGAFATTVAGVAVLAVGLGAGATIFVCAAGTTGLAVSLARSLEKGKGGRVVLGERLALVFSD
jgi:hypothetical protein